MKILSIETSCDETAISIVEATGEANSPSFKVLGNGLFSQIAIHAEFGGVFPMLAKREHVKNLPPILEKVLKEASLFNPGSLETSDENWNELQNILKKEEGLFEMFKKLLENIEVPKIDAICVTNGPGLEPALWVGISFALALGKLWDIPVVPVNHMEGHIFSVLTQNEDSREVQFPALALLISGGHTELVLSEKIGTYKLLGKTLDDAVGEAYDKTARMMGLPYPGGPEISRLAQYARDNDILHTAKLPRPMINSHDLNFSFSGLKTAVLYYLRDNFNGKSENLTEENRADIAREIDDAVAEVLSVKTKKALEENSVKTLIIAGGVIANKKLREKFVNLEKEYDGLVVKTPTKDLSTDNALMIASAGYIKILLHPEILTYPQQIRAEGNMKLD